MEKLSFSTAALFPLETVEALKLIGKAGFKHAEMMPQAFSDIEKSNWNKYLKTNVHVASIHYPLAMFGMLYSAHISMSNEGRDFSKKLIRMGHALDSKVVIIHPTASYEGEMKEYIEPRVLDNIRFLADLCLKNHITLAMENHPTGVGRLSNSLSQYVKDLDIEGMHPMVDTTEVREGGEDPFTFIKELKETPCHLHLSDFKENQKHLPIGKGEIDWIPIFKLLKDRGYSGFYTLEPSYRFYLTGILNKLIEGREYIENVFR